MTTTIADLPITADPTITAKPPIIADSPTTTEPPACLGPAYLRPAHLRRPRLRSESRGPCGKVWLVGSGPGEPELLTLKAARILGEASVWLIDDLVGAGVLALAAPGTRLVKVGKRGGCRSAPQDFILRLMARYARQGRVVARVKGGDPFVFGRGGEEIDWLSARGIPVECVAGLTAGLAVGAALNMPLTHRGVSRGVALVTAHTMDGSRPDWQALAASGLTVICYMGMSDPRSLERQFLDAGFAPGLPVTVVQRVSCPDQRHLITTVAALGDDIVSAAMASPAVIVLGNCTPRILADTARLSGPVESRAA